MSDAGIKPIYLLLLLFIASSCVSKKQVRYFNKPDKGDLKSDTLINIPIDRRIQTYDKIRVKVISVDPNTAQIFNIVDIRNETNEFTINLNSFEVDAEGYIDFPFVGRIYILNKTLPEARESLLDALSEYVSDVELILSFVNNKITVMGEVRRAGTYFFYDSRVTIFEAISYAGGILDYGRKDNVSLIRNIGDTVITRTVNLTDTEIIASDDYILKPGDILVVHPIDTKYRRMRDYAFVNTLLQSITTTIAVISIILTLF